ncbi:MAG TPA: peptidyl-prolyl cis-trans isomerase [Steroidobacteraceae bacterium]|nr:peptidyl-prolyl cis-trans isomerase [Steroidobacteraceae bacterium]
MTTYFPRFLLLAAILAALCACQPKSSAPADTSPPVATVNGQTITRDFFEFYAKTATGKTSAELTPEIRNRLLDNLIKGELVAQEAAKQGIDKTGDSAYLLELSRLNVLEQAVSDRYLKDKKPGDAEVRAEYETEIAGLPKTEYHARHILVATEPFAEKVIQRLDRGEKFEDLAKVESMDPSKNNGGDIGWLRGGMPPEIMNALAGLKPGEYAKKPVQTQYGWHILQLVESRPLTPPPFEQAKQRFEQIVEAKKFKSYMDELMRDAKVTKTLDQPASASAAPAPAPVPSAQSAAPPAPAAPAKP